MSYLPAALRLGLEMKTLHSFGMFFQSLGLEHELIGVTFCKSEISHVSYDMGGTAGRYGNNPPCTRRWFSPLYLSGLV